MPEADDSFPVVIVGGGLAGLCAALHLAARDVPPLLLEANPDWPGGRLAGGPDDSFTHQGREWAFPSEHGVHALWGNYGNMRAMLDRFIGIDLVPSLGEEWIDRIGTKVWRAEAGTRVRRSWLPAPFHYLQLLISPYFWKNIAIIDLFSFPGFLVSIFLSLGVDPLVEGIAWDGLLLHEYFRGWTRNLRETFVGLARSLLAAPRDQISLTAFIAALRFFTLLRRDSWHPWYLPGNPHHTLIRPAIQKIEQLGGMVVLGARADRLERAGDQWLVHVEDARRGRRSVRARHVILALDPPAAERLLRSSPATQPEADRLRFPAGLRNASVRLWFDIQPRSSTAGGMFTGECFADNFFWLHRIHREFNAWGAAGGSAIEMHLYARPSDLDQPDGVLLARAAVDVYQAFPELRGHFVYGIVRRNEATQTLLRVPTADSLHVGTPWPNLHTCGDWIGYPSPALWMERCCVTAIAAANRILVAGGKEPFEIIPPRQPEPLVRFLGWLMRGFRAAIRPAVRSIRAARSRRK